MNTYQLTAPYFQTKARYTITADFGWTINYTTGLTFVNEATSAVNTNGNIGGQGNASFLITIPLNDTASEKTYTITSTLNSSCTSEIVKITTITQEGNGNN